MEAMVALVLMGVILAMSSKSSFRGFESSHREAPVILMGCINEERRESQESRVSQQVKVESGKITHWNNQRRLKKTVFYDEDTTIEYEGMNYISFRLTGDCNFQISNASNQSGRINFIRNGKIESFLMIHLGSSTMDLRIK
ncbi:MAG: hypothetical protein GX829_07900 [Clostridium sp.]|nr:hypothetical protein [Clostridium sp.]